MTRVPEPVRCRGCGNTDPSGQDHVHGERKCCPDCDHRPVVLQAGEHPVPLDEVHEQMTTEELLRHLAQDHHRPTRRWQWAEQAHRHVHGEA